MTPKSTLEVFHLVPDCILLSHLPARRTGGADPSDGVTASPSVLTLTGVGAAKQKELK